MILTSNRREKILVSLLIPMTDISAVFNFSSFVGINKTTIKTERELFLCYINASSQSHEVYDSNITPPWSYVCVRDALFLH